MRDVDDQKMREELESCKQLLTDTEMENGRHRVFNSAMSSFDISLLNDKLDYVFKEPKCAAKVNLAFGLVLKNVEDGMCRYFYAHENNTVMEKSKLVCTLENLNSSVVAETMKLLANSSYVYQIMDLSRHTVTKYLNDEKSHSASNSKLLKRLNFINDQLYEVELVMSEIEHREPIIVGFFILQYA